ncbi:hypothetical protein ACFVXE_11510 [Streptomyces sp. NPDC058231]|uniref:hypothetical protein n=1 Tax=Streptomyces sp. NPDC058231 TaxID=3346392 RepID=UPI0036E3F05B
MLKPGVRLRSQCCATEVIVVRVAGDPEVRCGGHPMIDLTATPAQGLVLHSAFTAGSALGKRYTDPDGNLELLVTHAGAGSLSLGALTLVQKTAKPLPSSD